MSFVRSFGVVSVIALGSAVAGCSSSSNGGGGDAGAYAGPTATCVQKCTRSNTANCGDQSTCQTECESDLAAVPPSCNSQRDALISCALTATYTCTGGHAVACSTQLDAVNACILAAGTPQMDAGTTPATGSDAGLGLDPATICVADPADDTCIACDKAMCCNELKTCASDAACRQAYTCAASCLADDQACLTQCVAGLPPNLVALTTCQNTNCAAACQ